MPRPLWVDPYAAQSIGLLQDPARARAAAVEKIGEVQARAAEVSGNANANAQIQGGNAWAGAIQNIGQTVAAIPGQIQQAQQQSRIDAMQKLQLAQHQQQFDASQRLEETKRNIGALMNDSSVLNEDGTFNGKGILSKLSSLPNGASGPVRQVDPTTVFGIIDPINESLLKARTLNQQYEEHKTNTLAQLATSILRLGAPSEANPRGSYIENAQLGLAAAVKSGIVTQDQANSFLVPMVENPASIPAMLQSMAARSTVKPISVGADTRLVSGLDPTQTLVPAQGKEGEGDYTINGQRFNAKGAPIGAQVAPQESPSQVALRAAQLAEITAKLNGTTPISPKDRAELEIQRAKLAQDDAAPTLSADALKLTAKQYAMTGQLPAMGMGKTGAAVRTAIINQAANEYKDLDLPTQQAAYKANQNSLKVLQATTDKVSAFESTAGKNLDQFLALADKIPDTGVPWLNAPIRSLDAKVLGSAGMAAANAARDVALREIARVTNDPNLSGVLSDSARREVSALSPQDATFAQIKAVAKVLKQDMANVHDSLNVQLSDIRQRIATPPSGATTPTKTLRYNPATGKVE